MLQIIHNPLNIPLAGYTIQAGFPSPAEDYLEGNLDINDYLVKRPAATFLVRVSGNSMIDAGIFDGDIVVVDKSVTPRDGHFVVAKLNDEYVLKTFRRGKDSGWLIAENKNYAPIEVTAETDFQIWGVIVGVVRKCGGDVRAG